MSVSVTNLCLLKKHMNLEIVKYIGVDIDSSMKKSSSLFEFYKFCTSLPL